MTKGAAKGSRRDTGRVARLAVGVLAVLVLVINAAGLILFDRTLQSRERMIRDGLETSAAVLASAMTADSLFFLDAAYDPATEDTDFATLASYADLPSVTDMRDSLAEASRGSGGQFDVSILSPRGYPAFDAGGVYTEPLPDPRLSPDAALIERASAGETVSSELSNELGSARVYHPLRGGDGSVIGILRLETADYSDAATSRLPARTVTIGVLTTILIGFLWWTLMRLIRRSLQAERLADRRERLSALGTATAGIAHEIRNPLGIMLLSIEELQASIKDLDNAKKREGLQALAADLHGEVKRLSRLTGQFLELARERSEVSIVKLDVVSGVRETVRLFEKGTDENLQVRFEATEEALHVSFSEARLKQVLLNLMQNAREALDRRIDGIIEVNVLRHRQEAVIEVRDNGPGMDAATLNRIFDPFFTTRAEGSGLGLALSRTMVEAGNGRLELESTKGKGTTARVVLPLLPK